MRGRGDVRREEVFEKALPENIRWVADDAEYREFKNLVDVDRKWRLYKCMSASRAHKRHAKVSRTLSLYADRPCARTLDVMLSTAPCSVCETIDMAGVAGV